MNPITVETTINAPVAKVWEYWTLPEHITNWNFAQDDWECPNATNDLRVGGVFSAIMRAKDKSASFDFVGTYTNVEEGNIIEYTIADGRKVKVIFESISDSETKVTEIFDPETENPEEMQRAGWQAILDNFKRYVETH
jgi:uncharacterized protein YndB with AHSA1/START domain